MNINNILGIGGAERKHGNVAQYQQHIRVNNEVKRHSNS
jgi:hypothetical protein